MMMVRQSHDAGSGRRFFREASTQLGTPEGVSGGGGGRAGFCHATVRGDSASSLGVKVECLGQTKSLARRASSQASVSEKEWCSDCPRCFCLGIGVRERTVQKRSLPRDTRNIKIETLTNPEPKDPSRSPQTCHRDPRTAIAIHDLSSRSTICHSDPRLKGGPAKALQLLICAGHLSLCRAAARAREHAETRPRNPKSRNADNCDA